MRQIKALWLFMILWASGLHAQDAVTLTHPIAYIGHDHNLYLTDGTTTLPIASDADTAEDTPSVRYSQPRWSPDGSQLVFFQDPIEEGRSLMIMESGSLPQPLVGSSDDVYFENRVLAWSPDSTQIAFVGSYADQFGLIVVSVTDGQVRFVAPTFAPGIGEAGGEDPALSVAAAESGRSPYRERYEVGWANEGIVFGPGETCFCTALLTPDGEVVEEWLFGSTMLPSAEGLYIVGTSAESSQEATLLDVAHGAEVPLEVSPIAWLNGSLVYSTRTIQASVTGDQFLQTGIPDEDQGMWSFVAENAALQLWQYNPNGADSLIFETEGYDFGVVRPTADNRLLVSVISSNFDAVTVLNNGATPEDVQDLLARPITYLLEGDQILLTIEGGQPDYNSGTFTVVLPD